MATTSRLDLGPLVGSWRLLSWVNTFVDTQETKEAFGSNPEGRMLLDHGGRIMFLFMKSGRTSPTNDADRVAMFNEMVAYSGLVRLDGPGRFITTIDLSWNPYPHSEQLRFYTLEGDHLTIRTPPQMIPVFPGRKLVGNLVWLREFAASTSTAAE
jgi:Lipocalin-like domain